MPKPRHTSNRAIYAALAGNLIVAVGKFTAAAITGSSAMLSEGVHSVVDTSNEILLLYGQKRAAMPADLEHPLGHGRELYFWSFIVSLQFIVFGAGISFYEGVTHILNPEPIRNAFATYLMLALAGVCEGTSWWVARQQFRRTKGARGYLDAIKDSKDPTVFTVLFEDSAALAGLALAFLGIFTSLYFHKPELDGAASIGIGIVLFVTAIFLARETKGLLLGEQASPRLERAIVELADDDDAVKQPNGVLTVHLGPNQVFVGLSVEFAAHADAQSIRRYVERVEERIKAKHPEVSTVFVKPQSAEDWERRRRRLAHATAQQHI